MDNHMDSGYFDPSLTSVGSGYADLASGAFGAEDGFIDAGREFEMLDEDGGYDDDVDMLIALGLHMSD